MKSLSMYLGSIIGNNDTCLESILDDDDVFLDPANDKKHIEEWIKSNYKITGNLTISDDFVVDCSDTVKVKNKSISSLTNGLFRWGEVDRDFDCSYCSNIKTLEGSPKNVSGSFWCSYCDELKSLEGAPEKVGSCFYCNYCKNLTSLEGAPKNVSGSFWCSYCDELKSLEGAPEKVGSCFYCNNCKKLKITASDRKKYKIKD